jgi:hypothetical protein
MEAKTIDDQIVELLENATVTSTSYMQDIMFILNKLDTELTWNEETKIFTVCGKNVRVYGLTDDYCISVNVHGRGHGTTPISIKISDKNDVMLEKLREKMVDEIEDITRLDNTLESINNDPTGFSIEIFINQTNNEFDNSDLSDNTLNIIRDAVAKDLLTVIKEKLELVERMKAEIAELTPPKKWEWLLPNPCMWGSFDHGEVEGDTYEIAFNNAVEQLSAKVKTVNDLLGGAFTINVDSSNIELTEIK